MGTLKGNRLIFLIIMLPKILKHAWKGDKWKGEKISENKSTTKTGWNLDHSYLQLPENFYTRLEPTPVAAPKLVIFNVQLALSLGLDPDHLHGKERAAIFSGNRLPEGSLSLAQEALAEYNPLHQRCWLDGMVAKLGLFARETEDESLVNEFLNMMQLPSKA